MSTPVHQLYINQVKSLIEFMESKSTDYTILDKMQRDVIRSFHKLDRYFHKSLVDTLEFVDTYREEYCEGKEDESELTDEEPILAQTPPRKKRTLTREKNHTQRCLSMEDVADVHKSITTNTSSPI